MLSRTAARSPIQMQISKRNRGSLRSFAARPSILISAFRRFLFLSPYFSAEESAIGTGTAAFGLAA